MRFRVWQGWLIALIAAVVATGCGGDDDGQGAGSGPAEPKATILKPDAPIAGAPKPAESPQDAAERIAAVVHSGDCRRRREIFYAREMTAEQCRQILASFEPTSPPKVETFRTAAVVKSTSGGQIVLALDEARRYKIATQFPDISPPPPPPQPWGALDVMGTATSALTREDCESLVRVSLTYEQTEGEKFCALEPVRRLRAALAADPEADPQSLGGNGEIAFYGLLTKQRRYFTLVFVANRKGYYFFATSIEA